MCIHFALPLQKENYSWIAPGKYFPAANCQGKHSPRKKHRSDRCCSTAPADYGSKDLLDIATMEMVGGSHKCSKSMENWPTVECNWRLTSLKGKYEPCPDIRLGFRLSRGKWMLQSQVVLYRSNWTAIETFNHKKPILLRPHMVWIKLVRRYRGNNSRLNHAGSVPSPQSSGIASLIVVFPRRFGKDVSWKLLLQFTADRTFVTSCRYCLLWHFRHIGCYFNFRYEGNGLAYSLCACMPLSHGDNSLFVSAHFQTLFSSRYGRINDCSGIGHHLYDRYTPPPG